MKGDPILGGDSARSHGVPNQRPISAQGQSPDGLHVRARRYYLTREQLIQ